MHKQKIYCVCIYISTFLSIFYHICRFWFYTWFRLRLRHYVESKDSGRKPSQTQIWMQILNLSTSAKPIMTKLENFLVTLVNTDLSDNTKILFIDCWLKM